MKLLCLVAVLFCTIVTSRAATPSDASLHEMMKVMQVEQMLNQLLAQMDVGMAQGMDQALRQSLQGKELTDDQKRRIERTRQETMAAIREEMSFAKLKDLYLQVYRETFTQEEVNAITAFYRTKAGQALVEKTPVAMQKAGTLMQSRIQPLMQRLNDVQQEMLRDLQKSE
jgi:uncharacterized protein